MRPDLGSKCEDNGMLGYQTPILAGSRVKIQRDEMVHLCDAVVVRLWSADAAPKKDHASFSASRLQASSR